MESKVSLIIPTLNNTKGLRYLLDYFKDKNYQIIVIDNKPSDEKRKILGRFLDFARNDRSSRPKWRDLIYLPQKRNLGFAAAINLGAKKSKTKWILMLNDDIEFYDDKTILYLIKVAQEKKWDAVSPILKNPDGRVENYGYRLLPIGKIQLVKEFSISNPPAGGQFSKIDGLTAACLLIKTEVFRKLKGFDESFFAYLEDVDFFLRFKKAGYKMGIANNIKVLHHHMTTSKTMGNFKARQDMVNWWKLYFKHKEKFQLDFRFILERLKNVSGFLRASFNL